MKKSIMLLMKSRHILTGDMYVVPKMHIEYLEFLYIIRTLSVERLPFHLPGQKNCTFNANEPLHKGDKYQVGHSFRPNVSIELLIPKLTQMRHLLEKFVSKISLYSLVENLKVLYIEFRTFFMNGITSKRKIPSSTIFANIFRFLKFYQLFIFNFFIVLFDLNKNK